MKILVPLAVSIVGKPSRTALALTVFAALCIPVSALTFNFTFTPESTAQDIAGFNAAGAFWSSKFSDNVTLNMDVGTAALGTGILAQAGSTQGEVSYTDFRNHLAADATSAFDNTALSSLATGTSFGMLLNRTSNNPNGSGSATAYLDNDGDDNNTTLYITTANAKAIGYTYAGSDASITFGNSFSWDYDSSNGISSGSYDFVGIAIHEIGHSLGFISGVDILDGNSPPINGPFSDDQFTYVSSLDLFRYSTASAASGVIDWTASATNKYFSLNNGTTAIAGFSTGLNFGDGRQASHWKDNLGLGVMDPTAATGETLVAGPNDFLAFDVIGWDVVPEPSSVLLGSFGMLFAMGRRRR
ncbi:MAG: NF038122 family metalloprotease [Luteolibacter sp.]|uniref:NF038122 family metalloprotease n=1 Tax=Luteolibacter sp. TaxID=1962973 RepID=UPI003266E63B